jgi:hypothetical protein
MVGWCLWEADRRRIRCPKRSRVAFRLRMRLRVSFMCQDVKTSYSAHHAPRDDHGDATPARRRTRRRKNNRSKCQNAVPVGLILCHEHESIHSYTYEYSLAPRLAVGTVASRLF